MPPARWFGFVDPFLVIMMAVTALKRSVGGTMGQSLVRFESAVVGSVLGFLAVRFLAVRSLAVRFDAGLWGAFDVT